MSAGLCPLGRMPYRVAGHPGEKSRASAPGGHSASGAPGLAPGGGRATPPAAVNQMLSYEERIAAASGDVLAAAEDMREIIATELAAMSEAWTAATHEAEALAAQSWTLTEVAVEYRKRLGRYSSAFP